jgi:tetratricopeptide (TPR) repeat protein
MLFCHSVLFGNNAAKPDALKGTEPYGLGVQAVALVILLGILVWLGASAYPLFRRLNPQARFGQMTVLLLTYVAAAVMHSWWYILAIPWCCIVLPIFPPKEMPQWLLWPAVALVPLSACAVHFGFRAASAWNGRFENRALRLHQKGNTAAAVTLLQQAIRQHGPTAGRCATLANLLGAQGDWQEALALNEQAEVLSGGNINFLLYKAVNLRGAGRLLESLESYREAERRFPDEISVLCEQGMLLVQLDRLEEAAKMLRRVEQMLTARTITLKGKDSRTVFPAEFEAVARLRSSYEAKDLELWRHPHQGPDSLTTPKQDTSTYRPKTDGPDVVR